MSKSLSADRVLKFAKNFIKFRPPSIRLCRKSLEVMAENYSLHYGPLGIAIYQVCDMEKGIYKTINKKFHAGDNVVVRVKVNSKLRKPTNLLVEVLNEVKERNSTIT